MPHGILSVDSATLPQENRQLLGSPPRTSLFRPGRAAARRSCVHDDQGRPIGRTARRYDCYFDAKKQQARRRFRSKPPLGAVLGDLVCLRYVRSSGSATAVLSRRSRHATGTGPARAPSETAAFVGERASRSALLLVVLSRRHRAGAADAHFAREAEVPCSAVSHRGGHSALLTPES